LYVCFLFLTFFVAVFHGFFFWVGELLTADRLDFVMCNPPFYESEDELISSADAKSRPPFSVCYSFLSFLSI
jgi:tRNA1(Val) A37 N6-methylase TrmN6